MKFDLEDAFQAMKAAKTGKGKTLLTSLLANDKSPQEGAAILTQVCLSHLHDPATLQALFQDVLKQLKQQASPTAEAEQAKALYLGALAELKQGPLRPATYARPLEIELPGSLRRVEVITPDGHRRYPVLAGDVPPESLRAGVTVFLDPESAVVLGTSSSTPEVGQQATFLRRLPQSDLIELQARDERFVLSGSQDLLEGIAADRVKRGDRVVFCARREFAFCAVPSDESRSHRFVAAEAVPDVVASRDIGSPHWSLAYLVRRTHLLLNRRDLLERFDLRPRVSLLMVGPSGTGKTLTIRAFLREFCQMLFQRTGRQDLGSRIIRVKTSDLLSPWFGESDKKIDELFEDLLQMGTREETTADGARLRLPVVLLLEECEALARRRGDPDGGGGVYDRVIGTLLQRLDDPTDDLAGVPLIIVASSNRPDMLDVAMWRRLAGMVARFPRLDRDGFHAVLAKKIKSHYPFESRNGHDPAALRRLLLDEVVATFYSPNVDEPLVEITFRDGAKVNKSRRHFLTGALVEQGVSAAIDRAAFAAAESGSPAIGLSAGMLLETLEQQVDNLADNLTAFNVGEYVDLPENCHVAEVRRLRPASRRFSDVLAEE